LCRRPVAEEGGATSTVEEGGTQARRPRPRAPPHRPCRGRLRHLLELIPSPRSISSPTAAAATRPHQRPPPRRPAATLDDVASSAGLRVAARHHAMAAAAATASGGGFGRQRRWLWVTLVGSDNFLMQRIAAVYNRNRGMGYLGWRQSRRLQSTHDVCTGVVLVGLGYRLPEPRCLPRTGCRS
jgi:hypothetical protein